MARRPTAQRRAARSLSLGAVTCVVALAPWADAAAEGRRECVRASELGQSLRIAGRLTAARQELLQCAMEGCPAVIRQDCERWLTEVEQSIPTIVLAARDEGGVDLLPRRVLVDGVAQTTAPGAATSLDPGPHEVRVEVDGHQAATLRVVARQGEKNRLVTATLLRTAANAGRATNVGPADDSGDGKGKSNNGAATIPTGVWIAGGLGGAALVASAILGGTALADYGTLRDTCAPQGTCDPSAVDSVRARAVAADVTLAAGLVAVAVGAGIYLFAPRGAPVAAAPSGVILRF